MHDLLQHNQFHVKFYLVKITEIFPESPSASDLNMHDGRGAYHPNAKIHLHPNTLFSQHIMQNNR